MSSLEELETYVEKLAAVTIGATPFIMICALIAGMLLFGIVNLKQAVFLTLMVGVAAGIVYLYLKQTFEGLGGSKKLDSLTTSATMEEVCPQMDGLFNSICGVSGLELFAGDIANAACNAVGCKNCNYDSANCPSS